MDESLESRPELCKGGDCLNLDTAHDTHTPGNFTEVIQCLSQVELGLEVTAYVSKDSKLPVATPAGAGPHICKHKYLSVWALIVTPS